MGCLTTYLDLHFTTHEKVLILGYFNVGIEEQHMKAFCDLIQALSIAHMLQKFQPILLVLI